MEKLKNALSALKQQSSATPPPRTCPATPTPHLNRLSPEQRAIALSGAKIIKVQAYAGTGKTTTLEAFAYQARKAKGLYLTFNRSMAKNAQARFPDNIECRTHNSMALRAITSRDASWKMMRPGKISELDPAHVRAHFNAAPVLVKFALATLHNFIYSTHDEILTIHSPKEEMNFYSNGAERLDTDSCLKLAKKIWQAMCDANSEIPMPHDGYLKMWALNPHQLNYDFILIDESQDSNPAFLQGMGKQRCRQIFVGDEHQAIYSFRGAINALDSLMDAEEFTIKNTRRFGQSLSDLANAAIALKNSPSELRSLSGSSQSLVTHDLAPLGTRPLYLARTNAGLFEKAVSLAKQGKGFHLIGGGTKFSFPDLHELLDLAAGRPTQDNAYSNFPSIGELIEAAESSKRHDLAARAKLVKKYGAELPAHLASINKRSLPQNTSADNHVDSLSTVHQAKGLEADWVELLDDFPPPQKLAESPTFQQIEEVNILYVAITRAKLGLATGQGAVAEWARTLPPPQAQIEADQELF